MLTLVFGELLSNHVFDIDVYLNLAAACKLTLDGERRNKTVIFDPRWQQIQLPNYFHKIAEVEEMKDNIPDFDDFWLLDKFLCARRRKRKSDGLYNTKDKGTFGTVGAPPKRRQKDSEKEAERPAKKRKAEKAKKPAKSGKSSSSKSSKRKKKSSG